MERKWVERKKLVDLGDGDWDFCGVDDVFPTLVFQGRLGKFGWGFL